MGKFAVRKSFVWAPVQSGAWLIWGFCAVALILFDLSDGEYYYGFFDDRMRALQVRDLVNDGHWFDLTVPQLEIPGGYISPWSRLVDAPLAGLVWLFTPLVGTEMAFSLATAAWPLIMLAAVGYLMVDAFRLTANRTANPIEILAMVTVAALALLEFVPGRIDHHNVQILLLALLVWALASKNEVRGGLIAGLAIVLSVTVGLETLPFIITLLSVLIAAWAMGAHPRVKFLKWIGASLVAAAPASALLFLGPEKALQIHCDSWSAPFIAALTGGGIVLAFYGLALERLGSANWHLKRILPRIAILSAPLLALLILLATTFPACLSGPYEMIDPVSRWFWFDRVPQEAGIAAMLMRGEYSSTFLLLAAAFATLAAFPGAMTAARRGDAFILALLCTAIVALVLTLFQTRNLRFPGLFAAFLIPWASAFIADMMAGRLTPLVKGAYQCAIALTAIVLGTCVFFTDPASRPLHMFDINIDDHCAGADLSVLGDLPPSEFMAAMGAGLAIAEAGHGHKIAALPFHRASTGISRVATVFAGQNEGKIAEVLRDFDYVAICARPGIAFEGNAPLYEALNRNEKIPGLSLVTDFAFGELAIWRIDKDELQSRSNK